MKFKFHCLLIISVYLTFINNSYADDQLTAQDDSGHHYFSFSVDQDKLTLPLEVASLNHAITSSDRLFVKNGHFYRIGDDLKPFTSDDTRVKLYGISLSYSANFPTNEQAIIIAKRLKKLGYNAVRLHHMDSQPSEQTNPKSILLPAVYPTFNKIATDRLKFFIQALSHEGIYINLNLHVGYQFKSNKDGIPLFDQNVNEQPFVSSVHVYTPHLIDLQKTYASQLVQQLDLKDNPALAMIEINNESSLLASWTQGHWAEAVPSNYAPILQKHWQDWLVNKYGSLETACHTWGNCDSIVNKKALIPSPSDNLYNSSNLLSDITKKVIYKIKAYMAQNKNDQQPTSPELKLQQDFLLFLASMDQMYFDTMKSTIRNITNPLVPVTGTQMSYGYVLNFDSMKNMDYIDEHFYIDYPEFPNTEADLYNWHFKNLTLDKESVQSLFANGFRKQKDKPFIISEYNMPFPNPQGAMIQPMMATVAASQDWDGIFFYDYINGENWSEYPGVLTLTGDWGKFALTGQSALLYREAMPALTNVLTVPLNIQSRLNITSGFAWHAYENFLKNSYNLSPEIGFTKKIQMDIAPKKTDTPTTFTTQKLPWIAENNTFSFTEAQLFTINTDYTKGIIGNIPKTITPIDKQFSLSMPEGQRGFLTLLITSADKLPVSQSKHLLLTLSGATISSQPGSYPRRPKQLIRYEDNTNLWTLGKDPDHPQEKSGNRRSSIGPTWQDRTEIYLYIDNRASQNIIVYPLDGTGQRLSCLAAENIIQNGQRSIIHLQNKGTIASLWYEIVFTQKSKQ